PRGQRLAQADEVIRMRRREFIRLLTAATVVWPLVARSQQSPQRFYKIGYLQIASRDQTAHLIRTLENGLRDLGYRVGENVTIEYRFGNGDMERLPALAEELVRLGVDIIVTGNNANTAAALKATKRISIVMTVSVDPVGAGFIANLAQPGGNVTGLTQDTGDEISGKRLEFVKKSFANDTPVN